MNAAELVRAARKDPEAPRCSPHLLWRVEAIVGAVLAAERQAESEEMYGDLMGLVPGAWSL